MSKPWKRRKEKKVKGRTEEGRKEREKRKIKGMKDQGFHRETKKDR